MTAALYALRARETVLLLEKTLLGGQIAYSPKVRISPARTACPAVPISLIGLHCG